MNISAGGIEAARQHQHYQQVRARLWSAPTMLEEIVVKPAPPPVAITVPAPRFMWIKQYNAHVIAFRQWKLAEEIGAEYVPQEYKPRVDEIIMSVLADFPGITIEEIKGPRRTRGIVRPRQLAMYEVYRQRPDMSYPQIGRAFGGRDHTTCLHAVRKLTAEFGEARA